jgi:hypothetical protein
MDFPLERRENVYSITESGKYMACISGLIEIDKN